MSERNTKQNTKPRATSERPTPERAAADRINLNASDKSDRVSVDAPISRAEFDSLRAEVAKLRRELRDLKGSQDEIKESVKVNSQQLITTQEKMSTAVIASIQEEMQPLMTRMKYHTQDYDVLTNEYQQRVMRTYHPEMGQKQIEGVGGKAQPQQVQFAFREDDM